MKKNIIFIFVLIIALTLAACGQDNGIVGTWEAEGVGIDGIKKFIFNEDGNFTQDGTKYGTYTIVGTDLILNYIQPSTQGTVMGNFEINGKTMLLTLWGIKATFIKK